MCAETLFPTFPVFFNQDFRYTHVLGRVLLLVSEGEGGGRIRETNC
jgi:hypothetical protein